MTVAEKSEFQSESGCKFTTLTQLRDLILITLWFNSDNY